jgi:phosphoesterase RecJ-like protein
MKRAIQDLEIFLNRHEKLIITTHESPDPDGIGAEIAFFQFLNHLGKNSVIVNADKTPEKYMFLDISSKIMILGENFQVPADILDYGIIILDTNDYSNTGTIYKTFKDMPLDIFIIDHHARFENETGTNYIDSTASSTSEMVFEIITAFDAPVSFMAGLNLYAGILFDTGSFRYPKTTSRTFRTIAALVDLGVSPTWIYDVIYETYSVSSLRLKSKMLSSMEYHFDGKLVLMHLTPDMLKETGGIFSEGEININIPLTVKDVVASVLIKQDLSGPLKVSMRTKGGLDVAEIAIARHGGGHKNAAGYKSKVSWEETRKMVLDDMSRFFPHETYEL